MSEKPISPLRQRHGLGVGLELVVLLDAQRQEHAHHLELAEVHSLFVRHAGQTGEKGFVILD